MLKTLNTSYVCTYSWPVVLMLLEKAYSRAFMSWRSQTTHACLCFMIMQLSHPVSTYNFHCSKACQCCEQVECSLLCENFVDLHIWKKYCFTIMISLADFAKQWNTCNCPFICFIEISLYCDNYKICIWDSFLSGLASFWRKLRDAKYNWIMTLEALAGVRNPLAYTCPSSNATDLLPSTIWPVSNVPQICTQYAITVMIPWADLLRYIMCDSNFMLNVRTTCINGREQKGT